MANPKRPRRTLQYIRTHWPIFFALYGSLVAAILLIGVGLASGWYSFIPFSLAIMMVASYFLVSYVYIAYQLNDAPGGTAAEILFEMSQARPEDRVVCIDLGLRATAVTIAQRLTTGEVTVIDVYNPQSNIGGVLHRGRDNSRKPPDDPRANWIDGSIDMLPLPDRSAGAVFMNQILSEYWLSEERDRLLAEVLRILVPDGRLMVAERVRSRSNLLLTGPVTYSFPSHDHWRSVLEKAGFIIRREELARGLIYCVRADRPGLAAAKQMALDLEYV